MSECLVKLTAYFVERMSFSLNPNYSKNKTETRTPLDPEFDRKIVKRDENNVFVALSMKLTDKEKAVPFHLDISVCGIFEIEKWEENETKKALAFDNTTAILFPFMRSLASMLTANANIPAYILPVFNIVSFFSNQEKKKIASTNQQ